MLAAPKRLPGAVADLIHAAEWYDDKEPGLGDEFVKEVNAVIKTLPENAFLYSIRFADVRCVRLRRFKEFGIYYFIADEQVIILSVFHAKKHPLWLKRRRRKTAY